MDQDLVYQEYKIDQQPWNDYYTDKIQAAVKLAHRPEELFLEFMVREPVAQARFRKTNGQVYKDSCVEFFVQFDQDVNYYNLECNVLGNIRFFYGPDRNNRSVIAAEVIEKIERKLVFQPFLSQKQLYIEWRITAVLPLFVFLHHRLNRLENHRIRGNFYKCADDGLPHYLSWSYIKTEQPDFHRPEYFGLLDFK